MGLAHTKINMQPQTKPLEIDWNLNFTQPATKLAHAYWRAHCRDTGMPAYKDLQPSGMRGFIAHIGIVEVRGDDAKKDYFIRLAGSRWEEVFGRIAGKHLHEFLSPEIEERWRALFDPVCASAKPLCARTGLSFQEKTWLMSEMFVAPLGDSANAVSKLFLCFTATKQHC
jgi:hypothetical protein